ncbi:MAG TPA: energy transducer TonB, partial [Phnomibacter sp.]|nr:energy transducer TonB [Phnomibacter sp.]
MKIKPLATCMVLGLWLLGAFTKVPAQSGQRITTPLNAKLAPTGSEKNAYALEERWLQQGQWRAKLTEKASGMLLAEYGFADSTRNTLHGTYTSYWPNRRKQEQRTYHMGQIDGPFKRWSGDGILGVECMQTGERYWGHLKQYDAEGILHYELVLDKDGNGTGTEFLPKAGLQGTGMVVGGELAGVWEFKNEQGQKLMEREYLGEGKTRNTCFDAAGKPLPDSENCIVSRMAEFPGGPDAWSRFLQKNLTYPKASRKADVQGVVQVKFLVSKEGAVSQVKALSAPDALLAEEAVRVV